MWCVGVCGGHIECVGSVFFVWSVLRSFFMWSAQEACFPVKCRSVFHAMSECGWSVFLSGVCIFCMVRVSCLKLSLCGVYLLVVMWVCLVRDECVIDVLWVETISSIWNVQEAYFCNVSHLCFPSECDVNGCHSYGMCIVCSLFCVFLWGTS